MRDLSDASVLSYRLIVRRSCNSSFPPVNRLGCHHFPKPLRSTPAQSRSLSASHAEVGGRNAVGKPPSDLFGRVPSGNADHCFATPQQKNCCRRFVNFLRELGELETGAFIRSTSRGLTAHEEPHCLLVGFPERRGCGGVTELRRAPAKRACLICKPRNPDSCAHIHSMKLVFWCGSFKREFQWRGIVVRKNSNASCEGVKVNSHMADLAVS